MASKLCISTPSLARRLACLVVGGVVLPSVTIYSTWKVMGYWAERARSNEQREIANEPSLKQNKSQLQKAIVWVENNVDLIPKTTTGKKVVSGIMIGTSGISTALAGMCTLGMVYDGYSHARQTFKIVKDPNSTQMCCTLVRRGLSSVGSVGIICLFAGITTAGVNLTRSLWHNHRYIQ